jgi:2-phospho-L-lactate guanylyltransferase
MKELRGAKMRLAGALDASERAELALAMLTDVIRACSDSGCFEIVAVISGDSEVHWHARDLGAKPLAEPKTLAGLNESLTFGQRYLGRRMAAAELVIVPADVPLVAADDVRAVVAAIGDRGDRVALVRARDNGTNALAMRPVEAIPMRFGPDSADAHRAAARSVGIEATELDLDRLRFDVDDVADIDAMTTLAVGAATRGWIDARAHAAPERAAPEAGR